MTIGDELRATLGARDGEDVLDAARRVVRERDEALSTLRRSLWSSALMGIPVVMPGPPTSAENS